MNEPDTTEVNPVPSTPKPTRKRKASGKPRQPRVIDPAIAAIRAETAAKVKAYREAQKSGKRLETILKLLAMLTQEDRNKLAYELAHPLEQEAAK